MTLHNRPSASPHDGAREAVGEWQRLSALYEEVDALDDAAMQARLAQLQGERHPLLAPLRQMLAARERVQRSDFLGTPPLLPCAAEPMAFQPWGAGSRVGAYRLQRHLGTGGMAEVWLAERADGAFQRQVALKLLFRHADSTRRDSFAQRFARERDILASLNHPNIAALHDAGVTPEGQPWLALEYVEGESITNWCNRQALGVRARVELFRQVLRAVQHAHANLIIHRDIKPGNILVSERGEVRLLDFGIAKLQETGGGALAETELTRASGRPLTVAYASPEQLGGLPLTIACDVYSLGVVLYELLCGERPYELKVESAGRMEQAILEADPRPMSRRVLGEAVAMARSTTPKALRRLLSPELDAVVLHMLAKQPAGRYASVESVLADLDRWCRGEPVGARTPSKVYRLRKFVLRHPLGVGFGAAAGVSLAVVAVAAVLLGLQARQQAARSIAATQFLFDMFRNADPDNSQGIGPAASLLLDKGRAKVLQTLGAQPELQAELLQSIAEVQRSRADYQRADETIADAIRIDAALGRRRDEARGLAFQAWIAFHLGDPERVEALLARAFRRHPNPESDAEFGSQYAHVRGLSYRAGGQLPRAKQSLEEALAKSAAAFGPDESHTVMILSDLALVEAQAREFLPAMDHVRQAIQRLENGSNASPTDRVIARDFQASIEQQAGYYGVALIHLQALAHDCENWLGGDSEYCRRARQRQAVVLLTLGRATDAAALMGDLQRQASVDESPVRQAEALMTACRVQIAGGLASSASEACIGVRRLGGAEPVVGRPAAIRFAALLVVAEMHLREARFDDSLSVLADAEARFGSDSGMPGRFRGRLHLLRGLAQEAVGRLDDAVPSLRKAVSEYAEDLGEAHPTTLLVGAHLAYALWSSGHPAEARARIDQAIPIVRQAMGPGAPVFIQLMDWRNVIQSDIGNVSHPVKPTDLLV